ncbi:MAG: cytidine deaminase [Actinomycetota bacterium]|jgi:cytidine deaminase|nr:cytidine deaminase [Actinomycetota bacterium]
MSDTLDGEDAKIVVLARTARLRAHAPHTGTAEGAALRDTDGRTYAAATVEHSDPALTTSALRGALSAAASSGARRFEAAALVTGDEGAPSDDDRRLLAEFAGAGLPVLVADAKGQVRETVTVPGLSA